MQGDTAFLRQRRPDFEQPSHHAVCSRRARWIAAVMLCSLACATPIEPAFGEAPRFQLPEGFTIEQVAAAPLVRYPLFACFDDAGRLYVAEGTGESVPGAELTDKKLGRITRLEDTDGDGRFDTSQQFADGLVFPQGVLWHDGVVYVASHPAIWRLEDQNGDGVADRRQEFVARFQFNGNGCDIHGPFLGPDGRIYWTDGRHGYQIARPDGSMLEGFAARIWRCRTDGGDLERIAGGGFDNPVELAWTDEGELIGTMDQGAGDCLLHYVEGGVYPEDHPCVSEFVRTGPFLGAVKRYSVELPAALCGTMRYRSSRWGDDFRDALITTHYMTHKLVRSRLIREGSTFRADDTDFLVSTDTHLRLTDVLEDADGSLLVIDMGAWFSYGFLGNVVPRPDRLGAIYRIRRTGGGTSGGTSGDTSGGTSGGTSGRERDIRSDPRGRQLQIPNRSARQLAALLDDPRHSVRDQAIARLATLGEQSVPALLDCLTKTSTNRATVERRANALWALARIDGPAARSAVREALRHELAESGQGGADDQRVLAIAAYLAGLHRDPDAVELLIRLLEHDTPPLRRRAAESLGRIRRREAVPALLNAMRRPADAFLDHALIYALIQIGDREALRPRLQDANARVRRAALVALDEGKDEQLSRVAVEAMLVDEDDGLQQAALRVVTRHPDWAGATVTLVRNWLAAAEWHASRQPLLAQVLLNGMAEPEIQFAIAKALEDANAPTARRSWLLNVVRQSTGELRPPIASAVARVLASDQDELRWEALQAIRSRGWPGFRETLDRLAGDAALAVTLRVASLECLIAERRDLSDDAFAFLVASLSDTTPTLTRLAAARTLAAAELSQPQQARLAQVAGDVNAMVLRVLLVPLSRLADRESQRTLFESLGPSSVVEALSMRELEQLTRGFPADIIDAFQPLKLRIAARHGDRIATLRKIARQIEPLAGDADAGKEIFLAPRNNCFACHRATGRGGTIGPDLSRIGAFRTRDELLESILLPSHSIAPQYQTHTLTTVDGRVLTGLVTRESNEAIELRTADLAEHRVPRAALESLIPATVSLMPEGLEKSLSTQELADLLEFLVQQR